MNGLPTPAIGWVGGPFSIPLNQHPGRRVESTGSFLSGYVFRLFHRADLTNILGGGETHRSFLGNRSTIPPGEPLFNQGEVQLDGGGDLVEE
jgi:hypothetical protein